LTDEVKRIVEALLFATSEPISLQKLQEIIETTHPIKAKKLKELIDELQSEYVSDERSFRLETIGEGYVLRTHSPYASYIQLLFATKKKEKLSHAAMEVLAIVAYKQPITKAAIEQIRGVDSSGVLQHLMDRELIEVTGKLEAPGRPSLYSTTKEFLKYFGLHSLDELPHLEAGAVFN
jgi:segregation and condensation protein B